MNEASKQLVLQNKIANRVQWVLELESQEKQLKSIKKIIDIFDEQRTLQRANSKIMLDNFEVLKPTWKFETVEKYMDNQKRLQELSFETKEMEWEQLVSQRSADYDKIKIQHEELLKALENLDKDIKELN